MREGDANVAIVWNRNGPVDNDPWGAQEGPYALLPLDAALEAAANGISAIGVKIEAGEDVLRLQPILDSIALVALNFPAFNDGRAFSHASLLRERLNYSGDIRGIGAVLIDQIPLMLRVGIDSVVAEHAPTVARLREMRLPQIDLHYQPAAKPSLGGEGYSWRRRAS